VVSGQSGPAMYPASKCRMGLPQARSGTLCLSRWRWANLCRYVGTVPEEYVRGGPSAKGAATLMNCRDVGLLYGWMRFFKATFIQVRPPNRIYEQTMMLTDFLLLFVSAEGQWHRSSIGHRRRRSGAKMLKSPRQATHLHLH